MKSPRFYRYRGEKYPTKGEAEIAARTYAKANRLKVKDEKALIKKGPPKKKIHWFNPNSDQQVKDWLYGELQLPVQYDRETQQPSVSEKCLNRLLRKDLPEGKRKALETYMAYSRYNKHL